MGFFEDLQMWSRQHVVMPVAKLAGLDYAAINQQYAGTSIFNQIGGGIRYGFQGGTYLALLPFRQAGAGILSGAGNTLNDTLKDVAKSSIFPWLVVGGAALFFIKR